MTARDARDDVLRASARGLGTRAGGVLYEVEWSRRRTVAGLRPPPDTRYLDPAPPSPARGGIASAASTRRCPVTEDDLVDPRCGSRSRSRPTASSERRDALAPARASRGRLRAHRAADRDDRDDHRVSRARRRVQFGHVTLNRASKTSTAAAVADNRMECFTGMVRHASITYSAVPRGLGGEDCMTALDAERADGRTCEASRRRFASTAPSEHSVGRFPNSATCPDTAAQEPSDGEAVTRRRGRPRDDRRESFSRETSTFDQATG